MHDLTLTFVGKHTITLFYKIDPIWCTYALTLAFTFDAYELRLRMLFMKRWTTKKKKKQHQQQNSQSRKDCERHSYIVNERTWSRTYLVCSDRFIFIFVEHENKREMATKIRCGKTAKQWFSLIGREGAYLHVIIVSIDRHENQTRHKLIHTQTIQNANNKSKPNHFVSLHLLISHLQ